MFNRSSFIAITLFAFAAVFYSCSSIPRKASAVNGFEVSRYLGTWYEIARFDYRFERNLDNVTANYSMINEKEIRVLNRGYDYVKKEWKSATGTARFRKEKTVAALKVSFFKPFYTGYNVVALDKDYKYAMVAGKNLNYLWLLSREKTMPAEIRNAYLKQAAELGYDTTALIWVNHDKD